MHLQIFSSSMNSSHRQNKVEVPFLPEPEEDVLEGATGTLVGLQINYFSFLLAFFTGILLDKLQYIVFYVGYHYLAGVTNTLNTTNKQQKYKMLTKIKYCVCLILEVFSLQIRVIH